MLEEGAGGSPALPSTATSRGPAWRDGLAPLRYRLALLMHEAGAWEDPPMWQEYAAAEQAAAGAVQRGRPGR